MPQAQKQALFAACVARTVKGQLAFEPQARPELETTVAWLDIDFAGHVRLTADMLWSRINKSRILNIARTVFGAVWASARAKNKKPALAAVMEQVFAVGVSAEMHAAALAWMPPAFAAFDTGRMDEEACVDDGNPIATPEASAPDAGPAAEAEPAAPAETPVDPPKRTSVVESIEASAVAERRAAALAASTNGNGNAVEAGDLDDGAADAAAPAGAAGTADPMPPAHINGHDAAPDPLEIPEFLRRVH